MFINPWWIHHCAGNLEPENDPYSEEYEYPFSFLKVWQIILITISILIHTVWYGFGIYYMVKFFHQFGNWIEYLFIPSFIVLLLFYAMMNIITIKKILK